MLLIVINLFWIASDRGAEKEPKHEHLLMLMNTNAHTGRRETGGVGSKGNTIFGAYSRNTLNDDGELLLYFFTNNYLTLVNTFLSAPECGVSYNFIG